MPKFKITLERRAFHTVEVEVEADDEELAQEKAIEEDQGNEGDYGFVSFDDGHPEVISCEKTS